jgi:hypothetical protein
MNHVHAPHDASQQRYQEMVRAERIISQQAPARQDVARYLYAQPVGGNAFLASLAAQLDRRGTLSPRQWECATDNMRRSQRPAARVEGPDRAPGGGAAQRQAPRNDTPAAVGVYRKDGSLYVVREFTPQGEQRKVRYAREIVPLTDAQGDRLNQQGERVRVEERKAPGMQYRLTQADALPLEEVTALSIQWESCLVCGRHLRVAESVERGIGPVCHGRQAALLGG